MAKNPEGQGTAILAHITILGILIAVFANIENKHPFATHYNRQLVGINVLLIMWKSFDPFFEPTQWIWVLLPLVLVWIISFVQAARGVIWTVPLIGPLFQRLLKFIP